MSLYVYITLCNTSLAYQVEPIPNSPDAQFAFIGCKPYPNAEYESLNMGTLACARWQWR